MKKIILALTLAILVSSQAFAAQTQEDINEKIASIGFGKMFSQDPKEQIAKLFESYQKASNRHNIDKIKSFYSTKYVNSDGFNYDIYFKLIKQTWEMYPDMTYTTVVKSIEANSDYAAVQTYETALGTAKIPSEYLDDKGSIESCSQVIYYLEKEGNSWKIVSDSPISEKTFLKYGSAKNIPFDISAPRVAGAGAEYTVTLESSAPKDSIILGSITNEKITYPTEKPKEVFRKLKEDGILERVVTANKDGFNENAVVSVGITKAEITEEQEMKLNVSGVAFLMSRVQVISKKKFDAEPIENGKATKL